MSKRIYLTLALIFFCFFSMFSQGDNWFEYKIDSLFSVKMPTGEVSKLDTIIRGANVYSMYSKILNNMIIVVQKIKAEKTNNKGTNLPHDLKNMKKYYRGIVDGITTTAKQENIREIVDENIHGLHAINVSFYKDETNLNYHFKTILVNDYLYSFNVVTNENEPESIKDTFFNSIRLNKLVSTRQFRKNTSTLFDIGFFLGNLFFKVLILAGLVLLVIFIIKKIK